MSGDIVGMDLVTTTYKWTLGETHINSKITGEYISSPIIPLTESKFCIIYLYPKGRSVEQKDYLSIYLQSVKGNFDVNLRFGVVNSRNKLINLKTIMYSLEENQLGFGFPGFMNHECLDKESMMTSLSGSLDRTLTIVFELSLEPLIEEESFLKLEKDIRLKEFDELGELIGEEKFSDVTLAVEGNKLYAHKCILAKKSEVFASIFTHNMEQNERAVVNIDDVAYDVMREVLRFIYAGRVDNLEEVAMALFKAADKYLIESLKSLCEFHLIQKIDAKNVLEYLNFSSLYNAPALRHRCLNFLRSNAKNVASQSTFKLSNLDKDTIDEVFLAVANPEGDSTLNFRDK
ncbi:hypothetical protein QAD02_011014 [Eretmocerus hayati]|uniref:Uncharacterized protein n=1 Tax=Eretmocerus hayati TaxID=131215 RepID=A0ACC2NWI9_9HYME|nr:hypothetical protein QAD02_011014 [Eretmocerus hayati]